MVFMAALCVRARGSGSPTGQADQAAAARISAPPTRVRVDSSAAPSATDDRLANNTSESMISAAACASRREAPYCSAMLLARKPRLSARPTPAQAACGNAGAPTYPSAVPSTPAAVASNAPPPNIARMRASGAAARSLRSRMLVSAKLKPPVSASQSEMLSGTGQPVASVLSTISTPASASASRSSARGVGCSPSSGQASTTVQAGIR